MNVARISSLLIGYVFGCFMTGEIVARAVTGRSARSIGTSGNPGMANIMAHVGILPGLVTLAGDLGKCAAAAALSQLLFRDVLPGRLAVLWAGLGCTIGHDWPAVWRFRGGKGVATQCAAIVLFSPVFGIVSCIAGMAAVFATQYLSVGGAVIPAVFTALCLCRGQAEAAAASAVLTLLAVLKHGSQLRLIPSGKAERTDVAGALLRLIRSLRQNLKKK